ncbi:putative FAD-linked oxidoreductase, partial [Trichoderma lentiforme]
PSYASINAKRKCSELHKELPSLVHYPSSSEYESRNAEYYSKQQQELHPACIIRPKVANDVSHILQIANSLQCPFAVASGGHMCWKGSSNIDGGFLIDLRSMNKISIQHERQMVELGPGATWINVYAALEPHHISTAGGRISGVGVGGFLLGGGIAFASAEKGLGANNVINYEVVLSNGTIVNANEAENEDLFWAMKLPSTNYGIVTRFDMRTYHSPAIWGAVNVYPFTPTLASELYAQSEKWGHDDTNKDNMVSIAMMRNKGMSLALAVQVNEAGVTQDPLTSDTPIMHLETTGSTYKVVREVVDSALAATTRTRWHTITTKIDTEYFMDIFEKSESIMKPHDGRENILWSIAVQHFQKGCINAAKESPIFNALGQGKDDLVNIHIRMEWANPDDDAALEEAAYELGTLAETEARKRGILNDFIYLNYADGSQPVYERSVTPGNMEKMREIKKAYDPAGIFDRLWRGGYKLPVERGNMSQTDADNKHDEL